MTFDQSIPTLEILKARKRLNDATRRFFDERSFLEVETPIAVVSPGLEPHLVACETILHTPNGLAEKRYLHTSPEYAMKRLLGQGCGHIYQIARVFRDGERSHTHTPEFSMLEWYRHPGTLTEIMDDVQALITWVAAQVDGPWQPEGFERLSVSEAFERAGLVDPLPLQNTEELKQALDLRTDEKDSWDDVFHRAMLERVEPTFSNKIPTILYGYPASMAALARIDPTDSKRCLRFEVYAGQLELANAFGELTDPVEQRRRFNEDLEMRQKFGRPAYPIDEALLSDLGKIGEAAGIALGLDRLLMLCLGEAEIHRIVAFAPTP